MGGSPHGDAGALAPAGPIATDAQYPYPEVMKMTRIVGGNTQPLPDLPQDVDAYNYPHFRTKHFLADVLHTMRGEGVQPGQRAPDFELETTDGERIGLHSLRGKPVVLHFGSYT